MQPDGKKIKYIPSFDKQDRSSKASLQYVMPKNGDFAASRQDISVDLSLK